MWIIKLGGSLLGSAELTFWLERIARHGDGKVVIVPGGGIFADAVREAQKKTGMDDRVAHQLAVMAMDQYGVLLAGLHNALVIARSELEIAERSWQHRAIVWLPSQMVCAEESIPASWEITSDSLAAWLANKLNAEHLLLVKSLEQTSREVALGDLVAQDVVDSRLGDYISRASFKSWVIGKQHYAVLENGLSLPALQQSASAITVANI
ncbi:MAG TPA: uridylate kinase [Methylophilaceae bacterium]|nr:uridylate kinase [Methylophilaceae bacterium]